MTKSIIVKFIQPLYQNYYLSASLLILRLITGSAFMLYGWGKIQTPFSWNPEQSPVVIPGIFQFLATLSEFGGGIALILGLFTPLASLGIGCTMCVAVYLHSVILNDPFVNMTGGSSYDTALVYLGITLLLLAAGPGRLSLDYLIFGERGQDKQQ